MLAERPLIGERDPRSEDRQLLLDALLAATERLIITYTGNDERTNAAPPAGGAGRGAARRRRRHGSSAAARAREQVVVHHPLQPFDPRELRPARSFRTPAGASTRWRSTVRAR